MLAAAQAAGARRFVAQSFAGWPYAREGGPVKTEEDALDPTPPPAFRQTLEAIRHLESAVAAQTALDGLVLRYGSLYGPGTAIAEDGWMASDIERRVPVIGGGTGIWSFIHIDDAARFTLAAITRGKPGIYNIVDDDPAPVSPLAEALGAKPPRRIPAWIARFIIGDAVMFMTSVRGASNASLRLEFAMAELAGWISTRAWRPLASIIGERSRKGMTRRLFAAFQLGLLRSTAHNGPMNQRDALHLQPKLMFSLRSPAPAHG